MMTLDELAQAHGQANEVPAGVAPVSLDDLAKQAPQSAQTGLPFTQGVPSPKGVHTKLADSVQSAPAAQPVSLDELAKQHPEVALSMEEMVAPVTKVGQYIKDSPVGKALEFLDAPGRSAAGLIVRGLDKTVSPGLAQKLIPEGGAAPDVHYSDILNYYLPNPSTAPSEMIREQYKMIRAGLGVAANVVGDPLYLANPKIGQLTKGAEELYKAGRIADEAGNAIKLEANALRFAPSETLLGRMASKVPGVGESIAAFESRAAIPLDPIKDAAKATGNAIENVTSKALGPSTVDAAKRAAQVSSDLIRSFSPWTSDLPTNVKLAEHNALARGAEVSTVEWAKSMKAAKFTEGENQLISNIIEKSPNVSPEVGHEFHANIAFKDSVIRDEKGALKTLYFGTENPEMKGLSVLTEDSQAASQVAARKGVGANVQPVYLNAKNPLVMDRFPTVDEFNSAKSVGHDVIEIKNKVKGTSTYIPLNAESVAPKFQPHKSILGGKLEEVIPHVDRVAAKEAERLKVTVDPTRMDQIKDAALKIKLTNALDTAERIKAGDIHTGNIAQRTIESYLVHKISPRAEAWLRGNPKMAAAVEEAGLLTKMEGLTKGSTLSSYDPGKRFRAVRTTLEEANQIMKEKTGFSDFFHTDPIATTAVKRLETQKFLRDKQLLEAISQKAVPRENLRQVKFGNIVEFVDSEGKRYAPIPHPDFKGQTFMIMDKNLKKNIWVKQEDLLFPKEIADKISYQILPRQTGNISAFMDSYNRIFRGNALMKVDYYLENWIDNVLKNHVNGVKLEDYVDTYKILFDKGGSVNIGGKEVPLASLKETLMKYNVMSQGHFSEVNSIDQALFMGKKVAYEQGLLNKAKIAGENANKMVGEVFKGLHVVGDRGENMTRAAFMTSLLKRGYAPEMAAFEVEKWLFNFKRTTQNMDYVRRFIAPFAQAAFKTAEITPGLLARKAYVLNAYENTLMKTVANAYNDPVTNWAVQQLYPDYYRLHDRVAGALLPANHWLAILATKGENRFGLPVSLSLGLPGGLGILNQFLLWDNTVQAQWGGASPQLRTFGIMLTGKDPWNGANVDISKNAPDLSRRLNYAVKQSIRSVFASPNIEKILYKHMGVGDPQYFEPEVLSLIHGNFGKFGRMTNLDKEYLFKTFALVATEKELTKTLASSLAKELTGRTTDVALNDKDFFKRLLDQRAFSSAEVYEALTANHDKLAKTQLAREILSNPGQVQDPKVLVGMIKNLQETSKQLNENYKVVTQESFKARQGLRAEEIKAAEDMHAARLEQAFKQHFNLPSQ
jgi:hypothetical protein